MGEGIVRQDENQKYAINTQEIFLVQVGKVGAAVHCRGLGMHAGKKLL